MKRTLTLTLCALMLASMLMLTGCEGLFGLNEYEQSVLGTWICELDFSEEYGSVLAEDPDLAPHANFEGSVIKIVYTFNEDGTYEIEPDEDSAKEAYAELEADLTACYTSFVNELATINEIGVDEVLALSGFASIEEVVETDLAEIEYEDMINEFYQEGNFEAESDKLFFSDGKEYGVDEEMYETYELDGDTLTLLSFVDNGEVDTEIYPVVLKKK